MRHAQHAGLLLAQHADPWDRLLAAQAKLENFGLISNDSKMSESGIAQFWQDDMPPSRILLALTCALALQGCVALAVVPILAGGGAIVRSAVSGDRTRQAIAEGTDIVPETIDVAEFAEFTLLDMDQLPAPPVSIPRAGPLAELHREASALVAAGWLEGAPLPGVGLPESALLVNPASLAPSRAACEEAIPAMLVDLDPGEQPMPLDGAARH